MASNRKEKESLLDYARKLQEEQKEESQFKDQGRVPDQQNRLKDQENLRK
ncbi:MULTISPECIES: hypothetical protein [Bacillus]|nr:MULTISPECIES: hypothetical protein [Bacillus]